LVLIRAPRGLRSNCKGRDLLDAFKDSRHHEAFTDAVRAIYAPTIDPLSHS